MKLRSAFGHHGAVQFTCAFLGAYSASTFLPSSSIIVFLGCVFLMFGIPAYRSAKSMASVISIAFQFRDLRAALGVYGLAFLLGTLFEYGFRNV